MSSRNDLLDEQHAGSHAPTRRIVVCGAVLLLCIGTLLCIALTLLPSPPELPSPPAASHSTAASPPSRSTSRAHFFDEHIQPAVADADEANRQAAERCVQRLKEAFDGYRKGIQPFSDDLTSWGTRWGVIRRMPADWWYEKTDIRTYVTQKFEAHLFSEDSLQQAIADTLKTFDDDVAATNNRLLTTSRAAISASDLPGLPNIDYSSFLRDVSKSLQEYSAGAATRSITNFILTELISGVSGAAATQVVAAIGTRIAGVAATTSATAGGATAGGAAAGGGGGTVVGGPVGTVVGLGVGLAVGIVVDWWMSSRFEEQLSTQLNDLIDNLESFVVDGSKEQKGIRQSLAETCDALRDAYRQSLYDRIIKESVQ